MSLECQKCEDNFCCIYLGHWTCTEHCRRLHWFCISCQLYNIEETSPAVFCQSCNFLLECYGYKYVGKLNGRDSYTLQRSCIYHCYLKNCPHRDEVSVELNRVIPAPDYSHLIQNGSSEETLDVYQQSAGTQQLEDREASIPSGKGYPRMVPGI